jgi:acyl-CoA dehydrogenase
MSENLHQLEPHYLDLQERARELAAKCAPMADRADESDGIDEEVRSLLAAGGLAAVQVPRAHGGEFDQPD